MDKNSNEDDPWVYIETKTAPTIQQEDKSVSSGAPKLIKVVKIIEKIKSHRNERSPIINN